MASSRNKICRDNCRRPKTRVFSKCKPKAVRVKVSRSSAQKERVCSTSCRTTRGTFARCGKTAKKSAKKSTKRSASVRKSSAKLPKGLKIAGYRRAGSKGISPICKRGIKFVKCPPSVTRAFARANR